MNVTCTRVPVFNGHSEAVFIRTEKFLKKNDLVNILESFNGVTVVDDSDNFEYPTPLEHADDTTDVYVGRIRSVKNSNGGIISLWIVADNVHGKGAALNAAQILERLIKLDMSNRK